MALTENDQAGVSVRTSAPTPRRAARQGSRSSAPGVSVNRPKAGYKVKSGSDSVYDYYADLFRDQGYGDLGRVAVRLAKTTRNSDEMMTELRQTPQYAARFSGNILRQKAGLPMLPEQEYIAAEVNYRSVMRQNGLPEGFYDSPTDFADYIANDISPDEIAARAKMAGDLVNSKDPSLVSTLKDYYGLSKGDLAAYFLDGDRALPVLQKKVDTALLGAEADRAGFDINKGFSRKLVDAGIDQGAARQAYGDTARDQSALKKLADMDRGNKGIGTKEIVKADLGLDAKAARRIRRLEGSERSRFSGRSSGTAGLGGADAGSF